MRRKIFVIILSIICSLFNSAVFAAEKRNQLEDLLIWKMSDELKLNSIEEKKFTDIVKDLNKKKSELSHSMQAAIEKMGKASTAKQKEQELLAYRKILHNYNSISEDEFDRLKPLLGTERMVQYLVIKQDLTNRIKLMLAKPDSNGKSNQKSLPQPKLIEEK